jgi:hypothetical protein
MREDARAHDVLQGRAGLAQRRFDDLEAPARLHRRARIDCPSGHCGAVPATKMRSPTRTALL